MSGRGVSVERALMLLVLPVRIIIAIEVAGVMGDIPEAVYLATQVAALTNAIMVHGIMYLIAALIPLPLILHAQPALIITVCVAIPLIMALLVLVLLAIQVVVLIGAMMVPGSINLILAHQLQLIVAVPLVPIIIVIEVVEAMEAIQEVAFLAIQGIVVTDVMMVLGTMYLIIVLVVQLILLALVQL